MQMSQGDLRREAWRAALLGSRYGITSLSDESGPVVCLIIDIVSSALHNS